MQQSFHWGYVVQCLRRLGFGLAGLLAVQGIPALDAFPGAEGEGRETIGGRGGIVIEVTNLNDSGPGSLRAALEVNAPRTIVFRVSGTIELQSQLVVWHPYVTIAGQTAPGDGICIKNYNFQVPVGQVILRYLRFRPGNSSGQEVDALSISGGDYVIVDHCSATWSVDEALSVSAGEGNTSFKGQLDHVTVQWSIIAESLSNAGHGDGEHSKGSLIRGGSGNRYSFHHNLYAHHRDRSPYIGNYNAHTLDPVGIEFDFRNNVVYNWGGKGFGYPPSSNERYEGTDSIARVNFVNNFYKQGPQSGELFGDKVFIAEIKVGRGYFEGNAYNGTVPGDPWSLVRMQNSFLSEWNTTEKNTYKLGAPIVFAAVNTQSAADAYSSVLAGVGATLPARDAVDQRIVDSVINGTGAIINLPSQVGGWPTLNSITPYDDTDQDGMPDMWEDSHGLDKIDPDDRNGDNDSDGYTNLEEYLNGIVAGLPVPVEISSYTID